MLIQVWLQPLFESHSVQEVKRRLILMDDTALFLTFTSFTFQIHDVSNVRQPHKFELGRLVEVGSK